MIALIRSKLKLEVDCNKFEDYKDCIIDLFKNEIVFSMGNFVQHRDITCLEHSIYVAYVSYLICKHLGLDYRSGARGGMLHDFFLYDWHTTKLERGLHGFSHPIIALKNANKYFDLNVLEKDIIEKHMWPLTLKLPRYKESFIVAFADKYCTAMEVVRPNSRTNIHRIMMEVV
jgi:uncharacterized protein